MTINATHKSRIRARTSRPSLDAYFMSLAKTASTRATCRHRWQGAVIVKNKHVIAMGYNGAAPGQKDCLERGFCTKHKGGDCLAEGLHGESNAILSAAKDGISVEGATMYCIYSPCRACCNMIKAAGITKVYYDTLYDNYLDGPQYLKSLGVEIIMLVILDPRKMQHM